VVADLNLLAGLDPFELLDVECARVDRFWGSLTDDDWSRRTRCTDWTVRDMLGHLAFCEDYNRAGLDRTVAGLFAEATGTGASSMNELNAWGVRRRAHLPAAEVIEYWRSANESWRRDIRALGRDGTTDTTVGPYPSWQQAFYLAMEYATHGDDMGISVDAGELARRDRWRAQFTTYAVGEYDRPVTVTVVDGANVVRGEDAEARLDDHELADAGVARLPQDFPIAPSLRAALACLA
jgi:uncharacterized protein (TIGR03083 family)